MFDWGIAKTGVMPAAVVPAAVASGKPKADVSKGIRPVGALLLYR
jgi:hypothetical protein